MNNGVNPELQLKWRSMYLQCRTRQSAIRITERKMSELAYERIICDRNNASNKVRDPEIVALNN